MNKVTVNQMPEKIFADDSGCWNQDPEQKPGTEYVRIDLCDPPNQWRSLLNSYKKEAGDLNVLLSQLKIGIKTVDQYLNDVPMMSCNETAKLISDIDKMVSACINLISRYEND